MPDNKELRGPQDASRINMHEDYEVRYWTTKFGCSKQELREAVDSVGVSVSKVSEYLSATREKKG